MTDKKIFRIWALAVAILGCGGGSKTKEHAGAPIPTPLLSFEPADLTSEVGDTPLMLVVSRVGPDIPDELASGLIKGVSLQSVSDQRAVPIEVTLTPVEEGSRRNPRYLVVRPTEKLGAEWYEMRVVLSDESIRPHPLVQFEDGVAKSLFHPEEFPVARAVRMCLEQNGAWWLEVRFSELVKFVPVEANVGMSPLVAQLDGEACDLQANFDSSLIADPPPGANEFRFRCPAIESADSLNAAVVSDAVLSLNLSMNLESSGGRVVALSLVSDHALDLLANDAIVYNDCLHWWLPHPAGSN